MYTSITQKSEIKVHTVSPKQENFVYTVERTSFFKETNFMANICIKFIRNLDYTK